MAIAALHLASWRSAYRGIVPDAFLDAITMESRVVRWTRAVAAAGEQQVTTLVAEDGRNIVGLSSFGPSRDRAGFGEVYALHVLPHLRRTGIGSVLLRRTESRLRDVGWADAMLWVLRDNVAARRFYEAMGWVTTGRERLEVHHGYEIPEVELKTRVSAAPG